VTVDLDAALTVVLQVAWAHIRDLEKLMHRLFPITRSLPSLSAWSGASTPRVNLLLKKRISPKPAMCTTRAPANE